MLLLSSATNAAMLAPYHRSLRNHREYAKHHGYGFTLSLARAREGFERCGFRVQWCRAFISGGGVKTDSAGNGLTRPGWQIGCCNFRCSGVLIGVWGFRGGGCHAAQLRLHL